MSISLQPILSNEIVHLTPLQSDDFEVLYAAASDPLIWEQHTASDRWKRDIFEDFFAGAIASVGAFLIRDAKTGAVIGSSRYNVYNADTSSVEIGWTFLVRSHWGGTYNTAIKSLMLDHAFGFVDQVILHAAETNLRSCRAIERIGGIKIGTREDAGGTLSIRYAVTRESRT